MADSAPPIAPLKPFPWMPVYLEEWLSIRLTPEQKGALMDLRAFAWKADPPCTVPDDDARLAVISGLGPRWGDAGEPIRELLTPTADGRLCDRSLLVRYEEQLHKHRIRSSAGATGGKVSAKTRANGKQTPVSVGSLLPVLPAPLSILSSTAGRTENREAGQANGEAKGKQTPLDVKALRAESERLAAEALGGKIPRVGC